MTLSRHVDVDAARFRKELLFVCCKSDNPSIDRVRQLHEVPPSPTDKVLSPVSRALRARSFQGPNRMSVA
ncbi:hypothetical protein JG687_00004875 [Phytophthora cactorum]|uniref:Uncharacterized protein n=2 Tax=Phytophthora TaxID=4783 RepID=A0A329SFS3_9STRA|nr:hypothetical protein Pcac1_g1774 [Phytophthora cactorum]KAG3119973.1 hypothetical protein PI125_g1504 [Phytophthora idaei]KAG6971614.1 hypothetical protein JG688_00004375 [Phytophthora aleatoria]KAG2828255.1 hypothetical protein PC112_g8535 [Phytophthora cactorum]KAG2829853.1 hypothetical protein PC111_g7607 [Phytophthora cactorum]